MTSEKFKFQYGDFYLEVPVDVTALESISFVRDYLDLIERTIKEKMKRKEGKR